MASGGDGEVLRQDGEGVYQNLVVLFHHQGVLLLGTVLVAQEAGAFGNALRVNLCSRADNAGRVPLGFQRLFGNAQVLALCAVKRLVVLCGQRPVFHFPGKERLHLFRVYVVLPFLVQLLSGTDFQRAQMVFVSVVLVYLVLAQCCIAVPFPSAAEVQLVIDAPDTEAAADHQPQRIVFSVAGVGDMNLAQKRGEEGSWRAQTVNAKGIVAAVLRCPFAVVDEAGRKGLQLEVAHSVCANHHYGLLLVKGIHDALQGLRTAVQVVAVQLHHKASGLRVVYGHVPASANAQVIALGDEVYHPFVLGIFGNGLCGAVRASVVYNNQIEGEGGLLCQYAFYGILNGADAVADRNHNRSLGLEIALSQVWLIVLVAVQIGVDGTQMAGYGTFHLHLARPVSGVYIVKLFLSAQTGVALHLCVQELIHMNRQRAAADEKTQVIQGGMLIGVQMALANIFLQRLGLDEQHGTHLEIVSHGTFLILNQRHGASFSVGRHNIVVGIPHLASAVFCNGQQAVQGMVAQLQRVVLGI